MLNIAERKLRIVSSVHLKVISFSIYLFRKQFHWSGKRLFNGRITSMRRRRFKSYGGSCNLLRKLINLVTRRIYIGNLTRDAAVVSWV